MSQTYPQLKFSGTAQEVAEQTATQLQSSIEELIDFRERILHTHFGVSSVPKALHAPSVGFVQLFVALFTFAYDFPIC